MTLRKINAFPPPPTGLFSLKPLRVELSTFWFDMPRPWFFGREGLNGRRNQREATFLAEGS